MTDSDVTGAFVHEGLLARPPVHHLVGTHQVEAEREGLALDHRPQHPGIPRQPRLRGSHVDGLVDGLKAYLAPP